MSFLAGSVDDKHFCNRNDLYMILADIIKSKNCEYKIVVNSENLSGSILFVLKFDDTGITINNYSVNLPSEIIFYIENQILLKELE